MKYCYTQFTMLSYRRETALQGGLAMAQNRRMELGDIFTDIIGPSSTTVVGKAIEFSKKRKIRAITPLNVIQGHRFRIIRKPCRP